MAIEIGQKSIGLFTSLADSNTMPPSLESRSVAEQIEYLREKLDNVEILVERKADGDKLKSLIAISDEAIQIQAEDIVLIGDVTIASIIKEQNGTTNGQLPASITRIVGDRIQTGTIFSNNYSTTEGSAYDLDNGTITIGGSSNPALFFDGTNLTVSGRITADSFIIGKDTLGNIADQAADAITSGSFTGLLQTELDAGVSNIIAGTGADYRLYVNTTAGSVVAKHKDADETGLGAGYSGDLRTGLIISSNGIGMGYNDKSTGAWTNAIAIQSNGDVDILGTLTAGSIISGSATVNGVDLSTIQAGAASGEAIQEKLEVTGTTILKGIIEPSNTGAIRVGTISWNSTTGELVSGTGIAITEYGIIGASSGTSTFTLEAATGNATFKGDITGASGTFSGNIVTSGTVLSTGTTVIDPGDGSRTATIIGNGQAFDVDGVVGTATNAIGGYFYSSSFEGVRAISNSSSNPALRAIGTLALRASGKAEVVGNFEVIGGNADVARSVTVGGASKSFTNTPALYLAQVSNDPDNNANQIVISGIEVDAGGTPKASLNLTTDRAVEAGTGNFVGFNQLRIKVNGTEYNLPLEAA